MLLTETQRVVFSFVVCSLVFNVKLLTKTVGSTILWLSGLNKLLLSKPKQPRRAIQGANDRPGKDTTYRVCNSTSCDPIQTQPLEDGKVNVYLSSRAGDRFAFSQIPIVDNQQSCADSSTCWYSLSPPVVSISINETKTKQKIEGFGGSITDATAENILSLPAPLQQQLINDYFGVDGLQYSMLRLPIGGTDFSSRAYTLDDDHPDDFELEHFSLQKEDKEMKIPLTKKALELNPNLKVFGSSWSPPAWMKTNNKLYGKGKIIGNPGEKYYKTYANYLVKNFLEYKKENITFWGMTTQNEPWDGTIPGFPFNCLAMSPEQIRDFIKLDLGPALDAAGFTTDKFHIFIIDDQRAFLPSWTRRIMADPQTSKYVYGVAFHWYMNFFIPPSFLDQVHSEHPDLVLLSTEACTGSTIVPVPFYKNVQLGNWQRAQEYADDIIDDLNHWTSGWIDWNMALNTIGGPSWSKNYVDSPIIVNAEQKEYYRQPSFYILSHFSKFLPPNSRALSSKQKTSSWIDLLRVNLKSVAFRTPDDQIVLIALNSKDSQVELNVRTSSKTQFKQKMPPKSIATFVWKAAPTRH